MPLSTISGVFELYEIFMKHHNRIYFTKYSTSARTSLIYCAVHCINTISPFREHFLESMANVNTVTLSPRFSRLLTLACYYLADRTKGILRIVRYTHMKTDILASIFHNFIGSLDIQQIQGEIWVCMGDLKKIL